ncbi:hypothetical protein [Oribacterium sp. WCC10]|uniref:hypothetical protein n=1 Tax=Oribacterium sp. WCC10 TaxID=1855343 RepID=UPI0011140329|nr:hypothetical protein [Oribacterium sp. WCC10]
MERGINEYLGFDAVYCVNADFIDTAFINTCLITPTIPENAIYFETDEFYLIDKVEQEKSTITKSDKCVGVASSDSFKEIADEFDMSLAEYIDNYYPYKFEYLVDKKKIKEILVIDVCKRVLESLDDSGINEIENVNARIVNYQQRFWDFKNIKPENFKNMSDSLLLRSVTAYKYLEFYRNGNDLFFKDYMANFKIRKRDMGISDRFIKKNIEKYNEHLKNYITSPSEKSLELFCRFVHNIIYKNDIMM